MNNSLIDEDILLNKWLEFIDDVLFSFFKSFEGDTKQDLSNFFITEHLDKIRYLCDLKLWPISAFKNVCKSFKLNYFETFCLVLSFAFKNRYRTRQNILNLQNMECATLSLDFCYEIFEFYFGDLNFEVIREEPIIFSIFGLDNKLQKNINLNKFVDAYIRHKVIINDISYFEDIEKTTFELPIQERLIEYIEKLNTQNPQQNNVLILYGEKLSGKHTQIGKLANLNSAKLLVCDFKILVELERAEQKVAILEICIIVILNNAWLCFENVSLNILEEENTFKLIVKIISRYIKFFSIICEQRLDLISYIPNYTITEFCLGYLSNKTEVNCWKYFIEKLGISFKNVEVLSRNFLFTIGQIEQAAKQLKLLGNEEIAESLVLKVCQNVSGKSFGKLAKKINKVFLWNDLIICRGCEELLHWICDLVKFSSTVYDDLGFSKKISYGRSVSALFCGPPGTGKTMAAQVVANELKQELYKIDLSQIISKYIGETEKNLNLVFEAAKRANVVLFFDEADALFSKRTQINNSNDRFANAETSFLLQKIEEYPGVAILATNLAANFDTAFKRRLKVIVNFSLPDAELRFKLWKNAFPEKINTEKIDFEYLAEKFEISGSIIKSSAVAAAFLAAKNNLNISMQHIMKALKSEMNKNGNLTLDNDFNI